MDLKTNLHYRIYTDKIDNHTISIECLNDKNLLGSNIYTIWYYYNKDNYSTRFLYDKNDGKLFAFENGNFLTKRQQQLLLSKIEQVNEIEAKIQELQDKTKNLNITKL